MARWERFREGVRERLLVGTDEGTVEYVPARDRWLLDAVHTLLASPTGTAPILSRESIRTGVYHPAATAKFGNAEWARIEEMVAGGRPSPLLDMAVACAPVSEGSPLAKPVQVRRSHFSSCPHADQHRRAS